MNETGLIIINSQYPADKARDLANKGFTVAVCDTFQEMKKAVQKYITNVNLKKCPVCKDPMEFIPASGEWPDRWICTGNGLFPIYPHQGKCGIIILAAPEAPEAPETPKEETQTLPSSKTNKFIFILTKEEILSLQEDAPIALEQAHAYGYETLKEGRVRFYNQPAKTFFSLSECLSRG